MKKLTILFLTISLSANASWFKNNDKLNKDLKPTLSVGTTVDIDGGFGLRLGARYNQDFIKPAGPNSAIFNFEETGNWVSPSSPIDILSRYKLYVNDEKVAWRISGFGAEQKGIWSCEYDRDNLIKAIEKKYGTSYVRNEFEGNITIAVNSTQNREIEVFCANVKPLTAGGLAPKRFQKHSKDESIYILRIEYTDRGIMWKYQERIDKEYKTKKDARLDAYDI
jgi:hypothetical protein